MSDIIATLVVSEQAGLITNRTNINLISTGIFVSIIAIAVITIRILNNVKKRKLEKSLRSDSMCSSLPPIYSSDSRI